MSDNVLEYLSKIDMYANGIMRDKNEMDKVWIQASSIPFLTGRIKNEIEQLKADIVRLKAELKTETLRKELWTREFNREQIFRYDKQKEVEQLKAEVVQLRGLLPEIKEYIEEKEETIDGEFGSGRKLNELIRDGEIPKLYDRICAAIKVGDEG